MTSQWKILIKTFIFPQLPLSTVYHPRAFLSNIGKSFSLTLFWKPPQSVFDVK